MRYERKYRITGDYFENVIQAIILNPVGFSKRYKNRWVNSMYFDSINNNSLLENIDGISNRVKYRIRWYSKNLRNIREPILEKKIKSNMLGKKEYHSLKTINNANLNTNTLIEYMFASFDAYPFVVVRYLRSYFESACGQIRATVDKNIMYYPVTPSLGLEDDFVDDPTIILEIKYDADLDGKIDDCLQAIPYRVTKNSKYLQGMKSFWL